MAGLLALLLAVAGLATSCLSTPVHLFHTQSSYGACGQGHVEDNYDNTGDPGGLAVTWAVSSTTNCSATKVTATMWANAALHRQGTSTACDSWYQSGTDTQISAGAWSAVCDVPAGACYVVRSTHGAWLAGAYEAGGPYVKQECDPWL